MKVRRFKEFGEIVKEWANGTKIPPATVAEFRQAVDPNIVEIGSGFGLAEQIHYASLPASETKISFVIPDKADVNLAVPAGSWPLPEFYSDLAFDGQPSDVGDADKQAFKSSRIADYSSTKCM